MCFSEYRKKVSQAGQDKFNQEELMDLLDWLKKEGLQCYKDEVMRIAGLKRMPSKKDEQLIQQSIPKSINDWNKKLSDENYYLANAILFVEICKWIADTTHEELHKHEAEEKSLLIYNYNHLIHYMLLDSIVLLNDYLINIKGAKNDSELYGVGKAPIQHTMGYWQFIRQVIFGQYSFHSFIDREIDMSVGIIRMAIEVRMRRGFGILGTIRKRDLSVHPLSMHLIFECLKKYEDHVYLSLTLDTIFRIYGWSNIFVHSGIKSYLWLPVKVCLQIRDFLIGNRTNGWSVKNGIRMNEKTLNDIQECIKTKINQDTHELWDIQDVDAILLK